MAWNTKKNAWAKVYNAIDTIIAPLTITCSAREKDRIKARMLLTLMNVVDEFQNNAEDLTISRENVCKTLSLYPEPFCDIGNSVFPGDIYFIDAMTELCQADNAFRKYEALKTFNPN